MPEVLVNNITDKKELISKMIETLDELIAVLKAHCGPFSEYAVIMDPNAMGAEPVFTKDGINIVRGIKYTDRIKEFTRNSLQYIGSRIETSAGDGTTSAMIICATMLKVLLEAINNSKYICSTSEFNMLYGKIQAAIKAYYDTNSIGIKDYIEKYNPSAEDIKTMVRNISYWQAYTSSHGDLELSDAISELFANTPIGAWNGLTLESSRYETAYRYKTEIDTAQYTLEDVRPFPVSQVKDALGLECNRKNTRVIISEMAPCVAYVDTADLIKEMDKAIETGEELTVICPDEFRDANTLYHFDELFKKYPNHKTVIFLVRCVDKLNDITGARILGIPGLNKDGEHTLTYSFKNSTLKLISGLYPATSELIYPYKDVTAYRELLDHVNEVIKGLTNDTANISTTRGLKHVQKFLFKLTVIKRPSLILGGSSYDNVAAVDVAIDAISATKKSLLKGYVLGGNKTLYKACLDIEQELLKDMPEYYSWFVSAIFKAIKESVNTVYQCVYSPIRPTECVIDYTHSENVLNRAQAKVELQPDSIYLDHKVPIIIQPKTMDLELISRFGEVALKFLKIDKVITRV